VLTLPSAETGTQQLSYMSASLTYSIDICQSY
jgi:hypothetical protein